MSGVWAVLLLALLPGAGNFLGAMLAEVRRPSSRFLNWSLHTASGIVVAIVALELLPRAVGVIAGWWIAIAFALGGAGYVLVQSIVMRTRTLGGSGELHASVA